MPKPDTKRQRKFEATISVGLQDIEASYPAKIVSWGSGNYARVPESVLNFWGLIPGDEVLVTLSKVKRVKREGGA